MSDDADISTPTPTRLGSNADLARRMDKMEARQDTMETKVTDLAAIVARVELNQTHATELAKLRFDAVDTAVKNIDGTLERFMGRINAIVSGEVKLPQAQQAEAQFADYIQWRKETDLRLSVIEDVPTIAARVETLEKQRDESRGVIIAMGGLRQVILVAMAVMGTVVAVVELIDRLTP